MAGSDVPGGQGRQGRATQQTGEGSDLALAVLYGAVFAALLFRRTSHYPHADSLPGLADEAADVAGRLWSAAKGGGAAKAMAEGAEALERLAGRAK